jgi:hypothetical protein
MTILGVEKVNGANTSYFTCNVVGNTCQEEHWLLSNLGIHKLCKLLKTMLKKKIVESVYE